MTTLPAGIALVLAAMSAAFFGVLVLALAVRVLAPRAWGASTASRERSGYSNSGSVREIARDD